MIDFEKVLEEGIANDASDIHIICGLKPVLRIKKSLVPSKENVVTEEDIYTVYDYIVKGNVILDEKFKDDRRLDTSLIYKGIRMRVNISNMDGIPLFTLRIIKNTLPAFEELGIPDVVRQMTYQPQGVILVTGKTNSGKSTTLNALINNINEKQNKKILTLEAPVEYKHKSKKSIIIQKEVGEGADSLTFVDGVRNALREDCDILVIGAALLKIVVSQRLIKSADGNDLVMVPEVMVVDNIVAGCLRKEKFSISEIEDAVQGSIEKGSISLLNSLASLVIKGRITIDQAKEQIEEKNYTALERTISNLKMHKG